MNPKHLQMMSMDMHRCSAKKPGLTRAAKTVMYLIHFPPLDTHKYIRCRNSMVETDIFIKGSCNLHLPNGPRAGYGIHGPCETWRLRVCRRLLGRQTANRAELVALLTVLRSALSKEMDYVRIVTNSSYVEEGYNDLMQTWADNGWYRTHGGRVKNVRQWRHIKALKEKLENSDLQVRVEWEESCSVGDDGDDEMAIAKQLARKGQAKL
jgi:ribonuclease HI